LIRCHSHWSQYRIIVQIAQGQVTYTQKGLKIEGLDEIRQRESSGSVPRSFEPTTIVSTAFLTQLSLYHTKSVRFLQRYTHCLGVWTENTSTSLSCRANNVYPTDPIGFCFLSAHTYPVIHLLLYSFHDFSPIIPTIRSVRFIGHWP
jgi:hypothetical protein